MSKILNQIQAAKRLLASNRVHIYYDHDLAPQLWEDFKDQYSGYMHVFRSRNGADYIVFGDLERPQFKASHLKAMSKYDLGGLHSDLFGHWQGDMTKAELIEELLEVTTLDFYTKHYANRTWHNLGSTYTLSGYSQGDAVKVLVLDTLPEELPAPTKDYLHNLLFDPPIRGTILFDGKPFGIEDFLDDQYRYDKAQVIRNFEDMLDNEPYKYVYIGHADREEVIAFLTAMLPTEPAQYTD